MARVRPGLGAGRGGGLGHEHTELVPLGVGEHRPAPVGLAQVVHQRRAEPEEAVDLLGEFDAAAKELIDAIDRAKRDSDARA